MQFRKGVLAIDNGSTALRLGLVEYDRPDLFWPVENMENIRSDMHNPGEFPAACCPLREDWRESLGRNALDEPDHVLVKYLMYIIIGLDDNILRKYPLSEKVRLMRHDPKFRKRCRDIFVEWIRRAKRRADEWCKSKRFEYQEVVFALPETWTKPYQDQYYSIAKDVFPEFVDEKCAGGNSDDRINFISEGDCLSHYMIKHESSQLQFCRLTLFADFGGHSMSYSTYVLEPLGPGGDDISFITAASGGGPGGCEMWAHHISELLAVKLTGPVAVQGKHQMVDDSHGIIRFALTKQFRSKIKDDDPLATRVSVPLYYDRRGEIIAITISADEIRTCFDKGMKEPMEMVVNKLKVLDRQYGNSIGVVIAGGSLRTKGAKDELLRRFPTSMQDRVKFADDLEMKWRSHFIAHGAGISRLSRYTVQEYFEAGCAIGVQAKRGRCWESSAFLVLCDDKESYEPEFFTKRNRGLELKLVCDAAYRQHVHGQSPSVSTMSPADCYDLYCLGKLDAGKWTIQVTRLPGYEGPEGPPFLSVRMTRTAGYLRDPQVTILQLPLYFDAGHNCLHIDIDKMKLDASALRSQGIDVSRVEELPSDVDSEVGNRSPAATEQRPTPSPSTANAANTPPLRLQLLANQGSKRQSNKNGSVRDVIIDPYPGTPVRKRPRFGQD